jgi:hypothetical protein
VNPPSDDAHRLIGLESLLRRLHRCRTPQEAVELVRRFLPDLARGGDSALFIVGEGDEVIGLDALTRPLWPLAAEAVAERRTVRGPDGTAAAMWVPGCGAISVKASTRLVLDEVRMLELFAEHAASALRRPGMRSSSASA